MESYQFPSTYTAISGLLDDVDNSKQWNFELWHYCIKATIYKKYSSIWYLYTETEILIDWFRRRVVHFRIVTSASYDTQTEKN